MNTEILPQCTDYQKAIYESLCRIEHILAANSQIERRTTFSPVLTVDEAAQALRISRSKAKQLIYDGTIHAVRVGRRVLVIRESLERLVGDQT
jgi:excisionase family DNA binding protein